jgi:pimeloyl-ACP methyl ester carboxylesterase
MDQYTVIVLPGLDGTGDLLEGFRAAAPANVKCIGVSYPTGERLGYDALEEYVVAQLPKDRVWVMVGESFSGPVAVRIARRFPDKVGAVVLCNSFVAPPRSPLLRIFARTALFRIPLPERILSFLMLSPVATPRLMHALTAAFRRVEPSVLAHRVRQLLSVDERRTLALLKVPVTYLRGTSDRLVPTRVLNEILTALPSVRVQHVTAPHALLRTEPEIAWAAIRSLIQAAG